MSTVKANNVQVGQSVTATNNFTLYQPATPDGTVRLGVGNAGATTSDVITATNAGNVTIAGTLTAGAIAGVTVGVAQGGTGQTTYTNGQLLIGNTTGSTLTKATLTADSGISITNGAGSITVALDYYTGSSSTNTSFPIGSYLNVNASGGGTARNGSKTLYYSNDINTQYNDYSSAGTALAGTWRARGVVTPYDGCNPAAYVNLFQRTA